MTAPEAGIEFQGGKGLSGQIRLRLLDEISELVWGLSPDGQRIVYLNRASVSVFGGEQVEVLRRDGLWLGAVHPADRPAVQEQLQSIGDTDGFSAHFRVLRSNGSERQLDGRFLVARDSGGAIEQIVVIAHDSSEQVKVQRHLTEAKAVYDSLVENLPIKVFRKNRHGRFVFCNQTFCEALGLSLDEIIGKTDADLFPAQIAHKYREDDLTLLETGLPYHGVEEHPLADGSTSWVEVIKSPVRDRDGRRVGIQGVFWDVTHRKLAERELQRARELAEGASRSRGAFLANVSHEIRTPMNGILGLTELLLEQTSDRNQREYLAMISQSAEGLMALINDILDFSKIEAGKLELDVSRFDLRQMVAESVRAQAVRAHAKGLELVIDLDPALPGELVGDAVRLKQVVTNLVANAIKFTERGHVLVRVTRVVTATSRDTADLLFEVEDSGIGIPPEKVDLIFREFEQVDSSTTRQYGGTGLGLAIVQQLVQLMGGEIRVQSEPGNGSRFWFRLELPVATAAEPLEDLTALLRDHVVVIVDDHAESLAAVARILEAWEIRVHAAPDGRQGLQLLRELARSGQHAHALFLDASLPDVSTAGFVEQVRSDPELAARLPQTAVMSAFQPAASGQIDLQLDRIHKPLTAKDLAAVLKAMLGLAANSTSHPGQDPGKPGASRLRVLLAEDNPVNQKVAVAMLERLNCDVQVAVTGAEALEMARQGGFGLILMDVQMPVMDGLEATREIRRLTGSPGTVRIFGLSAHAGIEQRTSCLAAGMDDFLPKPIRASELQQVIEGVANPTSRIRPAVGPESGRVPVLDWGKAMETVGGDRRLLGEIIDVFLEDCPRQVLHLNAAIAVGDATALRRIAHSLRSSLSYLGAGSAVEDVAEMEEIALSGDLSPAAELQKRLEEKFRQLTSELRAFKTSG